ncbi:MAG TPA: DUF4384 domain-containing protein [Blastocatellia bacterium]|nr:DUF4384 domain-containing protein [Blastocatellia bacterium]
MNFKYYGGLIILAFALTLSADAQTPERGGADEVRTAFLITRPKGKRVRPRSPGPLGLGYTIYQRDADERPVRVTASQEFRQGDAIRLMIESNTDGYLYVFHAENGQNQRMIFPDPRLNGGLNRVTAHVPYEVPSSREANPKFRWFHFDDRAAMERLYLVVTRRPLPGVLIGGALVDHCRSTPESCPSKPTDLTWNRIEAGAETATLISQAQTTGQEQTAVEREAITRGLGLPSGAPAPSVVKLSSSAKTTLLTVAVEVVHK